MRDHVLIIFFIGFSIFLGGCAGAGGGGGGVGNLYGTVVNLIYSPVSNADVVVGGSIAKTLSNGTYSFVNLPSGLQTIRITSTSHTPSYRQVRFSGGQSANAGIAFLADLDSKLTPVSKAAGGTATNTNGSIKIVFPSNSVTQEPTNVVLTAVPKVAAPFNPPSGDQFVSYIVYANPENMALSSPARLSVPNLTQVPASMEISFYKFDTDNLEWDILSAHGHSTTETNTIDVDISQLGWIAAIMLITPSPGWIEGTVTSSGAPVAGANVWTLTSYDVSDSSGSYKLENIPVGTTEVYASALGYQLYKSPVQTITSGSQTILNIDLSPYAQSEGNIEGTVSRLYGTQLYQARVSAFQGGAQKGVTYTDEYGRYTLYNIKTETTSITAYADDHIGSTETTTVIGGSTVKVDFNLPYIGTSASYEFTFETSEDGFATVADSFGHNFWHRQHYDSVVPTNNPKNYFNEPHGAVTRKVYLRDNGYIPTPESGSYYFWYGQASPTTIEASYIGEQDPGDITTTESGTGGESYNIDGNSGTLESSSLNLSGYTFGKLSFWTWWEIEGKNPKQGEGYDAMYIYVAKSPYTSWYLIGYLNPYDDPANTINVSGEAYTSGGFNQAGIWVQHNYDLTGYAGNTIKLRFIFNTHDRKYNGFRGWFLDDIKVENSQFGISSFGDNGIRHYPAFPKIRGN